MSETYTRKELVEALAKQYEMPKSTTEALVLDLFAHISKALKKNKKVTVSPFGAFEVRKRPARKGRNPRTGAVVKVAAKKIVKFKSYAGLKETIG